MIEFNSVADVNFRAELLLLDMEDRQLVRHR